MNNTLNPDPHFISGPQDGLLITGGPAGWDTVFFAMFSRQGASETPIRVKPDGVPCHRYERDLDGNFEYKGVDG